MSTLLMVASDVLLYEHHVSKGDIGRYDNSPLAIGSAITFFFGLLGCIITPIVGHKFYDTFNTNYNTAVTDIEQPIQQEISNHNQL
ncbi:hypothetical protein [Candidatus Mesenet endosymbiont of Agriotes lineatus]|uniref:hypothetical protein n=1 Tax=Candidatus Mesenet endosymbiont of Agriotes lineatus TaxID=3077948 RepID=UPI0030D39C02